MQRCTSTGVKLTTLISCKFMTGTEQPLYPGKHAHVHSYSKYTSIYESTILARQCPSISYSEMKHFFSVDQVHARCTQLSLFICIRKFDAFNLPRYLFMFSLPQFLGLAWSRLEKCRSLLAWVLDCNVHERMKLKIENEMNTVAASQKWDIFIFSTFRSFEFL